MKSILIFLPILAAFALTSGPPTKDQTIPGTVSLAWDVNPEPDVETYTVYYGTESGTYSHEQDSITNEATITLPDASPEYFFVVTASNAAGLESLPSNEVSSMNSVQIAPSAPKGLNTVTVTVKVQVDSRSKPKHKKP